VIPDAGHFRDLESSPSAGGAGAIERSFLLGRDTRAKGHASGERKG